jgi:DNA-binding MarR family transcriptional regulator/GNAT superfamily N-acetyltransferase
MEKDFIKELGYLAFSTRLKRISDNLMQDGRRMYQELEVEIEPNWFLIFKILEKYETLSVTEIAHHLKLAHPSVITITNKMEKAGFLNSTKSLKDSRKRVLTLSTKAIENLPEYNKIWDAGTSAMKHAFDNLDILNVLNSLESKLKDQNFKDRTLRSLHKTNIKIIDYKTRYKSEFTAINFQWLETYFYIEEYDREVLTKPDKYILEPGGHILFAKLYDEIIGTVALIVRENNSFELSKMGVYKKHRGLHAGQLLMDAAIRYSKKVGKHKVWLDSNRKLLPAIQLYQKNGFVEIPVDPNTPYERCNIRMEKLLTC